MQQPCHSCGFVSDRPTRFCRQCGAQLFVENEATSATTRQYAPQQPANPYDAPYQSQLAQAQSAPDNRFDDQTPDTSRLYQTPMAPKLPNYPANYQQAVAKKSGVLKWVLITLLCLLLVSGGIVAMVISAIRARHDTAERIGDEIQRQIDDAIRRAQQDQETARADKEAGAPAPPAPPPPHPASGAGLEQYKYPYAEVKNSVDGFGHEFVTMITNDSVSEVGNYYKKRLGDPMAEDEDSAAVIFHIRGSPATFITVNKDKSDSDKTQITVFRTNLQLPRMN